MTEHVPWRIEVRFATRAPYGVQGSRRSSPDVIARRLRGKVANEITIERDGSDVVLSGSRTVEVNEVRRALDDVLRAAGTRATATATVRIRRPSHAEMTVVARYQAPKETRQRRRVRATNTTPLLSRRAKRRWLLASVLGAVAGAAFYATSPGVLSYQVGFVLVLAFLACAMYRAHKLLPTPVEWTVAPALACAGPLAYLVFGGSQWWAWGQIAVVPLFALIVTGGTRSGPSFDPRRQWYGGPMDGPWGPP